MYACRQAWMYLCISVLLISKQWSQQRPNFSQFHPLKTSSIQLPETKEYIYLVRGTTLFKKQRLGQSALFSMQSVWGHHPHHTSIFIFSGRDVAPIEPLKPPKKGRLSWNVQQFHQTYQTIHHVPSPPRPDSKHAWAKQKTSEKIFVAQNGGVTREKLIGKYRKLWKSSP